LVFVPTAVVVAATALGFFGEDDDSEYIMVPKRTNVVPTAISNPNPFSKYSTEISSEVNLRRLRMKFSVSADDKEVSRWTPEIHMNLMLIVFNAIG
jgi:hypothetical protein